MDEIADRLSRLKDKYGPETLLAAEGTYRSDLFWARSRFFNLFGNPQNMITPGMVCMCNLYSLNLAMAGEMAQSRVAKKKMILP